MRVLLGVPWYFPDSVGGTEVYVRSLVRELRKTNITVAVASPASDDVERTYVQEGIPVYRYRDSNRDTGEIDFARPEPLGWVKVLDTFSPTVVDFHSLTSALELAHLKAARRRAARTIVTFHIPGVICARGTVMRFGKEPCSANLATEPCTACRLEAQGVPTPIGRALGSVPERLVQVLAGTTLPVSARRAVTAQSRDRDRREWLRQIFDLADRLVAPSAWLVDVLHRNGALPEKVVLCRQGFDRAHASPASHAPASDRLRVGFVGRYDPGKGLHILVEAARHFGSTDRIEIHVWGIARTSEERAYRERLIQRAAASRVIFHDESANLGKVYSAIDVLAVPSLWLETGPLVVLEAQASGVPIVGSNIGGIAERVTDGEDGLLVPHGDPVALAHALTLLARDRNLLDQLRPTKRPRTVADVAAETLSLYRSLAARVSLIAP